MNRGFTIFFAVLVSSLSLAVGLAIYDLLIRELQLSQTATQSQYAIYAADTGAECALYWDAKYNGTESAFSTSTLSNEPTSGISCKSQDIAAAPWVVVEEASAATTTFTLSLGANSAAPCALVTVAKVGDPAATTIISHGYNTCSATGVVRLERALQVSY